MWYAIKCIDRVLVQADTAQDAARIARNAPHVLSVLTVNRADVDDEHHQVVDLHPAKPADNKAISV